MEIVLGAVLGLALLLLVLGGLTGRVRLSSCCTPADPSKDLRMRGAFESDADADA